MYLETVIHTLQSLFAIYMYNHKYIYYVNLISDICYTNNTDTYTHRDGHPVYMYITYVQSHTHSLYLSRPPPLLPAWRGSHRGGVGPAAPLCGLGETLLLLGGLEDLERAHERVVHGHHRACVVKLAAVVRGAEDRHQLATREELVAGQKQKNTP